MSLSNHTKQCDAREKSKAVLSYILSLLGLSLRSLPPYFYCRHSHPPPLASISLTMDGDFDISAMNINATASPILYQGSVLSMSETDISSKNNCHACGVAKNNKELKKCAGCAVTLYCSKECQKGAWAKHK